MRPSLDGVRAKLRRAKHHFDQVQALVDEWRSSVENIETTIIQPHFYGQTRLAEVVMGGTPDFDPNIPLILGDGVHCLRSALDHVFFQLALLKGGRPEDFKTKTSFPIYDDPQKFSSWSGKIRAALPVGVFDSIIADLKPLQPYETANRYGVDARHALLYLLTELDVIDKHRTVLVAADVYKIERFAIKVDGLDVASAGSRRFKTLEEGTVIGGVEVPIRPGAPPPKVDVDVQFSGRIRLAETGLIVDDDRIEKIGTVLLSEVTTIINNIEREYFAQSVPQSHAATSTDMG